MRYSMDTVKWEYQRWFEDLSGLWGEGWGAVADGGAAPKPKPKPKRKAKT